MGRCLLSYSIQGSNLELPEGNTFDLINATYDEAGIYHCRGWYNRWYNASFNVQIQGMVMCYIDLFLNKKISVSSEPMYSVYPNLEYSLSGVPITHSF